MAKSGVAADPNDIVEIEILPEPKSIGLHAGVELRPGDRAKMTRAQAALHVGAGNARIVE